MTPTAPHALFQELKDHPAYGGGNGVSMMEVLDLLSQKIDKLAQANADAVDRLERLGKAFPGGDTDGHRLYHEEVIALTKQRREFWQKLTFELVKLGLLGFIGWLGVLAWRAVLAGPK